MYQARGTGWLRGVWDCLFGPPRVHELPDGSVRVRLLGRTHEGRDHEELFASIGRERERLLQTISRLRDSTHGRPEYFSARVGVGEAHHRDVQRLQDRLSVYNEFLGQLLRTMPAGTTR